MTLYGLIGAGGHARESMPIARHWLPIWHADGNAEAVFVVEDRYPVNERMVNGHRVLSMSEFLSASSERRFNIAIGDSQARARIARSLEGLAEPFSLVAASHVACDGTEVGGGAILSAFTHITSNVKIGQFFHCNFHSSVAHDCVIGDFVTFGPGVRCNGHVVVEDHAYIGAGVVIKDATDAPLVIGRGAVVGMGAVVTKSVAAGATVVGNPARVAAFGLDTSTR